MVGVNTVLNDNPKLNIRLWEGKNPLAIVIDPREKLIKLNRDFNLDPRKIITVKKTNQSEINDHYFLSAQEILDQLYIQNLQSVIIEGGRKTLQCFIEADLWDEAKIFVTKNKLGEGLKSPKIMVDSVHSSSKIKDDKLITIYKDSIISKSV